MCDFYTPVQWLDPLSGNDAKRLLAEDLAALFRSLKESDVSIKSTYLLRVSLQAISSFIIETEGRVLEPPTRLLLALLVHFVTPVTAQDKTAEAEHITAFALSLLEVSPMRVSGFTFGYVRVLCNPVFIPTLLKKSRGWALLCRLLLPLLKFLGLCQIHCPKDHPQFHLLNVATFRLFLIIIHDFPAFLSEYCFTLCGVLPPECAQLRNLIFSAFPPVQTLPDPHLHNVTSAANPEWLQEIPVLHDWTPILFTSGVFDKLKDYYVNGNDSIPPDILRQLDFCENKNEFTRKEVYLTRSKYNKLLIFAIVQDVIASTDSSVLTADWSEFLCQAAKDRGIQLMAYLVEHMDAEGQLIFFHSLCDQLRYPNPHTFLAARLLIYLGKATEPRKALVHEIIENRANVCRPHPWGLLATKGSFLNRIN